LETRKSERRIGEMPSKWTTTLMAAALGAAFAVQAVAQPTPAEPPPTKPAAAHHDVPARPHQAAKPQVAAPQEAPSHGKAGGLDYTSMLFVFMLATFIGVGVIMRVSRLLHTPLMSITNAISAIAVVGSIIVSGGKDYPTPIRVLGAIALFASMTNIISGFLITDRMLKMFKTKQGGKA
jgi:NAD(P) transhydrogenase subunit alpha